VSEKKIPVRVDEGQYDALTQIKDDVGIPIAESVHDSKFRTMVID
jgi:hypothetical protein